MPIANPNPAHAQVRSLISAGQHRQAISLIASLRKKPAWKKDVALLGALAECRMALHEYDEALDAIDKAIRLDPKNPMHHSNRGQALLQAMRLEPAERSFSEALALRADWSPAILGITETLRLLGREDEALARIEPLLGADRVEPLVDLAFARLAARLGRADESAERLARWVDNERVPGVYRMQGLFQIGALADRQGRHDEAFLAYDRANALRPGSFDPAKRTAMTDQVIRGSTRAALAGIPSPSSPSDVPIFIVGMPRSGTSLVEQVLSCHPRVFGAGELTAIDMLVRSLQQMNRAALRPDEIRQRIDQLAGGYLGLLARLSGGAEFVTDKNPLNFMHLGIISRVFPGARVIHCLRNPIDTCVSCYFHNFIGATAFTDDLAGLGSYYNDYRRLMEHWARTIEIPILDVVYEDVVADLEAGARRMLDFLGLGWDACVLEYDRSDRVTTTASNEQVRQPIYRTSVERWRRYERHLGPLIDALEPRFRPGV
ncbi:MAG: sulfotransferase [Phycisphaeraceae bacterium]|nr:sulfotransferase [Phycisphaeraceae bacterium]MCB9847922.1 sulfotransferase [Phycisphaeraceae bacterium]